MNWEIVAIAVGFAIVAIILDIMIWRGGYATGYADGEKKSPAHIMTTDGLLCKRIEPGDMTHIEAKALESHDASMFLWGQRRYIDYLERVGFWLVRKPQVAIQQHQEST